MKNNNTKTTVKVNRSSVEYSRDIFEKLYSKKNVLVTCARLLADSVSAAHRVSSSCWSVTLFPDKIRLNVGPVEVLVLTTNHVFLVIADSDNQYLDKRKYRDFITAPEKYYRSVQINQRRCDLPAEMIEEFYPLVHKNHSELIRKAAKKRSETTWKSSFSPGVILYLNALLKSSLPMPAYFMNQADNEQVNVLEEIEQFKDSYKTLQGTTREAVIQSRIGQGQFRTSLIAYWQGCSVTGCQQIELLRASHIKPWRCSSNTERLDIYNGLLLLPNLDACFDSGLISFDDNGKILISSKLDQSTLRQLCIDSNLKMSRVEQRHKDYLQYHRENRFHR